MRVAGQPTRRGVESVAAPTSGPLVRASICTVLDAEAARARPIPIWRAATPGVDTTTCLTLTFCIARARKNAKPVAFRAPAAHPHPDRLEKAYAYQKGG